MERHFDEELQLLKQKLLGMADHAQEMVGLAVQGLMERNTLHLERVFAKEKMVNRAEVEIEDEVVRLLATRQPIARDLRFLTGVLKINNDLERIADQACNIASTTQFILKEPPLSALFDVPRMTVCSQKMIMDSIEAFVTHDVDLAKRVCRSDDTVDAIKDQLFQKFLSCMAQDPESITRAVDFILISRNLERVADHATNICEEVIFIEEGKNIKHHSEETVS